MRFLLLIIFLLPLLFKAQDKLFFASGMVKKVTVVSISKDVIYYKKSDSSEVEKANKSELLMMESYQGVRFIYAAKDINKRDSVSGKSAALRNSTGLQPLGIFLGRGTIVYERFILDNKIGIVFPLSITFDPFGSLYNSRLDSSRNAPKRIPGVNFITGLEVNFYIAQDYDFKYFFGPRFRYGTDLFLRGIEAYSLQTQIGLKLGSDASHFTQQISIGFGFAKIVAAATGPLIRPQQHYGWYSINYRVNINW